MPETQGLLNDVYDAAARALRTTGGGAGGTSSVTTVENSAATATLTNVAGSASSVTLQAANVARRGLLIFNDSTATLYVKYGSAASATSFTVKVAGGGYFEVPRPIFTGLVAGIWDSATGSARMTELTA